MTQPPHNSPVTSEPGARGGEMVFRLLPLLVAAIITVLAQAAGADSTGALVVGAACGLSVLLLARPLTAYYLLLFIALLADYTEWDFHAWTHTLGFYVFENWWKLLSPEGVRKFGWLIINTVDMLIVVITLGYAARLIRFSGRCVMTPVSMLTLGYAAVFGIMFAYGLLAGGDTKAALWQIRPYFHFVAIALLGTQLIQTREQILATTWVIAAAVVIKAAQIIWIFFTDAGGTFGEWREILGHEDSVFFAGFIGLAAAYTLYRSGGRQMVVLLLALPVLLLALALNLRRAGYVALAFIFMLMPLALHGRRKLAVRFALVFLAIGIGYTLLFWDAPGIIGMPAEKLKSILFAQTATVDYASNLYRLAENVNLRRTILAHPLGIGFGHPFELYVPLADISQRLPNWPYYPHNMILGMWMTLGTIGFSFFLFYHASILMLAAFYMRQLTDRHMQALCFFALSSYAAGFLVASVDQFIWSERGAIYMGPLVAMISAMGRLVDRKRPAE